MATTQIDRAEQLAQRLRTGIRYLGNPAIGHDRATLAGEMTQGIHDVMGGLTASRSALRQIYIASQDGRDLAKEAEQAIIAAEHAMMRYREAVLEPHGLKPWEVDAR